MHASSVTVTMSLHLISILRWQSVPNINKYVPIQRTPRSDHPSYFLLYHVSVEMADYRQQQGSPPNCNNIPHLMYVLCWWNKMCHFCIINHTTNLFTRCAWRDSSNCLNSPPWSSPCPQYVLTTKQTASVWTWRLAVSSEAETEHSSEPWLALQTVSSCPLQTHKANNNNNNNNNFVYK